jgi:hypothetical protein
MKGAVALDENTAWSCFKKSGTVRDYLIYTQCRQRQKEANPQENRDEDGHTGPGGYGEARG